MLQRGLVNNTNCSVEISIAMHKVSLSLIDLRYTFPRIH